MKIQNYLLCVLFVISSSLYAKNTEPVEFLWSNSDDWYYKKSDAYQGWKYIVLHHSATNAGSVKAFHRFHTKQGYGGIAYHFVIGNGNGMKDGEVQETFRWQQQISGTHVTINSWDHNVFGIGICLVGNFENSSPSKAQMAAVNRLISKLKKSYHIKSEDIIGHKHVMYDDASGKTEQTVCPGKKLDLKKLKL